MECQLELDSSPDFDQATLQKLKPFRSWFASQSNFAIWIAVDCIVFCLCARGHVLLQNLQTSEGHPGPGLAKQPKATTLPPQWLTVGLMIFFWNVVFYFHHKAQDKSLPKSSRVVLALDLCYECYLDLNWGKRGLQFFRFLSWFPLCSPCWVIPVLLGSFLLAGCSREGLPLLSVFLWIMALTLVHRSPKSFGMATF